MSTTLVAALRRASDNEHEFDRILDLVADAQCYDRDALRAVVKRFGPEILERPVGVLEARIRCELHARDEPQDERDLHTRATAVLAERGKRIDELDERELLALYTEFDAAERPSAGEIAIKTAAMRFDVTARANKTLAPLLNVNEQQIVAAVAMAVAEVAGVS